MLENDGIRGLEPGGRTARLSHMTGKSFAAGRAAALSIAVATIAIAATVAGCSSGAAGAGHAGGTAPGSTSGSASVTASSAPSGTASGTASGITYISQTDNGKTVTTAAGTEVYVVLYSSYWSAPAASPAGILVSEPTRTPRNMPSPTGLCPAHQVAGTGCGLFVFEFRASAPGRTVISSTRTSCGEAMLCPASERDFAVAVRVTAR